MLAKLNWPLVAVFFIVAASVTVLAVFKVIPANLVAAIVAGFVGWLAPSPMTPATLPASPPEPPTIPPLPLLLALALAMGFVFSACAAGTANAAYDRDLATCELAPTCEAWVACRSSAATKNGRTFEAHCNADAGSE